MFLGLLILCGALIISATSQEYIWTNPDTPQMPQPEVPLRVEPKAEVSTTPETPALKIIKRLSAERGIDWKLVAAVCEQESDCNPNLDCSSLRNSCDGGQSYGAYQIWVPSGDKSLIEVATDFERATAWTIDYGYRFRNDPAKFFKNHNGLYKTTNQWYVDEATQIYNSL